MSSRSLVLSCVVLLSHILAISSSLASEPTTRGSCLPALVVIDRAVVQERFPQSKVPQEQKPWFWQTWQVVPASGLTVPMDGLSCPRRSWLKSRAGSRTREYSHATAHRLVGPDRSRSRLSASAEIIKDADESGRVLSGAPPSSTWTGDDQEPPARLLPPTMPAQQKMPVLSLAPGEILRVRLSLIHQHVLRNLRSAVGSASVSALRLGSAMLRDTLALDREHHIAQPANIWATDVPPEDRRDTRQFVSPPDSLHLEAHVPLNLLLRFPDQPVRYATLMRLVLVSGRTWNRW